MDHEDEKSQEDYGATQGAEYERIMRERREANGSGG